MKPGRLFLLTIVAAIIAALALSCGGGGNEDAGEKEIAGGPVSADEIANAALLSLEDIPPDPAESPLPEGASPIDVCDLKKIMKKDASAVAESTDERINTLPSWNPDRPVSLRNLVGVFSSPEAADKAFNDLVAAISSCDVDRSSPFGGDAPAKVETESIGDLGGLADRGERLQQTISFPDEIMDKAPVPADSRFFFMGWYAVARSGPILTLIAIHDYIAVGASLSFAATESSVKKINAEARAFAQQGKAHKAADAALLDVQRLPVLMVLGKEGFPFMADCGTEDRLNQGVIAYAGGYWYNQGFGEFVDAVYVYSDADVAAAAVRAASDAIINCDPNSLKYSDDRDVTASRLQPGDLPEDLAGKVEGVRVTYRGETRDSAVDLLFIRIGSNLSLFSFAHSDDVSDAMFELVRIAVRKLEETVKPLE